MPKIPQGKGIYIWMLDRIGTPEEAAAKAKAAGIDWVCIKFQDGAYVTDGYAGEKDFKQKTPVYVQAFRDAGIRVTGWGYVYGDNMAEAEGATTLRAVREYGLDCWLIDVEIEYEQPGQSIAAVKYCNALRSEPGLAVGLSSHRFPSLHGTAPWAEFLARVDFHAPQVYWEQAHNAGAQLRRSYNELIALRALPFVPVGAAYPSGSWAPTAGEMDDFYQVVKELGLTGWLWYEWFYAAEHPDWWEAISRHNPKNPPGLEERVGALEDKYTRIKAALLALGQEV